MCLALPRRVLGVEGDEVLVDWEGGPLRVMAAGIAGLAVGDYAIVHAGQVLERVSAEEAEEILALYDALESSPA